MADERDILVLAKTLAANEFPVERAGVLGIERETGELLRLTPFPWKGADTDPPLLRWSWVHVTTEASSFDPRPESRAVVGEVSATAYIDAKDGWRLRWPFVRPLVHSSLEALRDAAREGSVTAGYVTPGTDVDILQMPLRLRFRCAGPECPEPHELPVLDWEMHEMSRVARERYGATWATRFRETWGAALFARYDVRVLMSSYAQSPAKFYVAGLFYPPREAEDAHQHEHHVAHRLHDRG